MACLQKTHSVALQVTNRQQLQTQFQSFLRFIYFQYRTEHEFLPKRNSITFEVLLNLERQKKP